MQKISDLVITLENEKGEDIEIRTKKIDKARKNLGHWKEPQVIKLPKQYKQSLETAVDTSENIFTAPLTRKEAATIFQGVWRPKVEYPLGQTYLTDKHVNKIESASLPKVIAKCGYNRNMPIEIRGGLEELGAARSNSFKKYNRILLQSLSTVILLDHFMAKRVWKAYAISDSHIISLWPLTQPKSKINSTKNFLKRHNLEGKTVIMYSGNHSLVHPLDTLLKALEDFKIRQDVSFVFVGDGPGKALVEEWKKKHLHVPITLLPYQPLANLDESLGAADLHIVSMGTTMPGCVHPSKAYTVLAMGKPILYLGPKESVIGEWIKNNPIGWQVDHGDASGLRKILKNYIRKSCEERLELSENVLQFAELHLNRNKKLNEIKEVMEESCCC